MPVSGDLGRQREVVRGAVEPGQVNVDNNDTISGGGLNGQQIRKTSIYTPEAEAGQVPPSLEDSAMGEDSEKSLLDIAQCRFQVTIIHFFKNTG